MSITEPTPEVPQTLPANYEQLASLKSGANWFYWIAALSLINSLISAFGGQWNFIVGLGITQVVDGLFSMGGDAASGLTAAKIIGLVINLFIAGLFAGFGYFAGMAQKWAFIVGIVLYALDGALFLIVGDILAIGFHIFALFWIVKGFLSARDLGTAS